MVLSLLSQMPPTSTPPTIEECLAKLADNIDKLELVGKRLAASTANSVSISTKTTSLNSTIIGTKSNDETTHKTPIIQNNQLGTNTPTTIIPPSSITPPLNNEEQDKTKASNPTHNMGQRSTDPHLISLVGVAKMETEDQHQLQQSLVVARFM
ncbi:hypothetical protein Tco_0867368 [Tanacetum coccineum]